MVRCEADLQLTTHRLYDAIITRFIFLSFLRLAAARPLIVPFWTDRAFAFRALVLWAFEAPSLSVCYAAACYASWFGTVCLDVAILLATFAHFVPRAVFVADAFRRRTRRVCRQFWTDMRARKGRAHRMCCSLGTDTCRSSGDAQIVRITHGNFRTLSSLLGALQICSERKPSRV